MGRQGYVSKTLCGDAERDYRDGRKVEVIWVEEMMMLLMIRVRGVT